MKISTITGIIVVVLLNNAENVEKVLINKLKPFHSDVSVSTDAKQTHADATPASGKLSL